MDHILGTQFFQISGCRCHPFGSLDTSCNENGECDCIANVVGSKCMECAAGYFPFPTCTEGKGK